MHQCPECDHHGKSAVIESRPTSLGIYRRRKCKNCEALFTTAEFTAKLLFGADGGILFREMDSEVKDWRAEYTRGRRSK